MKKLKIRFIHNVNEKHSTFHIQRKTFFRWKDIGYWSGACGGGSIWQAYYAETKAELLDKILVHFKTCIEFVDVTEYPTILKY